MPLISVKFNHQPIISFISLHESIIIINFAAKMMVYYSIIHKIAIEISPLIINTLHKNRTFFE